jgi:hypothetical protein
VGDTEEWGGRAAADVLSLILGSGNTVIAGAVEM